MHVQMKLLRLEQSYDFETGETQNVLVMGFGGIELRQPVTEEQVAQIVLEARRSRGGLQTVKYAEPKSQTVVVPNTTAVTGSVAQHDPSEQSTPTELNPSGFVDPDLRAEGYGGAEVWGGDFVEESDGFETPGVETSGAFAPIDPASVTAVPQNGPVDQVAVPHRASLVERPAPAKTSTQLRKDAIAKNHTPSTHQQRVAELRARAAAVPQRRLSDSQVDAAGNPIVTPKVTGSRIAPAAQVVVRTASPSDLADEDGFPSA